MIAAKQRFAVYYSECKALFDLASLTCSCGFQNHKVVVADFGMIGIRKSRRPAIPEFFVDCREMVGNFFPPRAFLSLTSPLLNFLGVYFHDYRRSELCERQPLALSALSRFVVP
jgi:hypothetical protein